MERQRARKSSAMLNMPRRRRKRREHNWSHRPSPCSSGESASSEPRGSRNKGSVSCLQDISRGAQSTQTEELAQTSKIPDRVKAPLASRCNKGQRRRKLRSKRVTDRVLNGSTHGEASKQTQSQGNLKTKMKHLSTKTNTDGITDAKRPFSVLAPPSPKGATAAPHLSTSSTSSCESEEKKTDDYLSDMRLYTQTRMKMTSFLPTMPSLSSVSIPRIPSPECLSLQLGTSQCPGGAPLYRDGRLQQQEEDPGGAAAAEHTHQHLKDSSKDIVCRPKQRPSVDLSKEEKVCRICFCNDNSPENPLVSPCRCKGSMKYIHLECLQRCILVKLQSKRLAVVAGFCEVCRYMLKLDVGTFDVARFCTEQKKEKKGVLRSLFRYIGSRFRRMWDWRNPRPPEP